MNIKDTQFKLKTSPDSPITLRTTQSTQSLLTIINKNNLQKDNPYGTGPNLKFVDYQQSPQKNMISPSKNTSNQKNPLYFKHSQYKIGQKSPRTARVSEIETEQNRLSFKKSFKSIGRNIDSNNINNINNTNINTNNNNRNTSIIKYQLPEENKQNKQVANEELIVALKQIKRLRQVIEGLVRDNKKLKRIAHEILDGKFQDPVNMSLTSLTDNNINIGQIMGDQKSKSSSSSQICYNYLNNSILSNPSSYPTTPTSPTSQTISHAFEMLKSQNTRLNEQLFQLTHQLQMKQQKIKILQQSLHQQDYQKNQITKQYQNMKIEYIVSRNKIMQLEQKLFKQQKNNIKLEHFRGDEMAQSRQMKSNEIDESDEYSIVQQKITNNNQHNIKLQSLLKDQQITHQCQISRVTHDYQNIIAQLRGRQKKVQQVEQQKDSDSIRTKQSQSIIQSDITIIPLKKQKEYERVGELMRLGSRKG